MCVGPGLRDLCDAEGGLWLHADGAYGGAFALTLPDLRAALSHCDSVTVDGHKAFFLSFGVAFLLCRRQRDLFEAHSLTVSVRFPCYAECICRVCDHVVVLSHVLRAVSFPTASCPTRGCVACSLGLCCVSVTSAVRLAVRSSQ